MTITVEATYQNGTFKSVQPVSLPDGTQVRLTITVEESSGENTGNGDDRAELPGEESRLIPDFIWSKARYRARKAAHEFSKETHADY